MIVLLVFLWAPTEATQRLAPSVVLTVLMVGGYEALRRKAVADFPDESWETAVPRWRARFAGAAGAVGGHARRGSPDPEEERIRRLERLQELRGAGLLDGEELGREKARILGENR